MFFAVRKTNRGCSTWNASRAINILHRVFIIREQLHEIAEISQAHDSQQRFITASAFGQPVGAYYHDTSFTKRNYCLLPKLRCMRRKFTTLCWAALLSISDTRALAPRALFWHHCQKCRLRYRVVNSDHYIEAMRAFRRQTVFMEHPVEQSASCAMGLLLFLSQYVEFIILK